MSNSPDPVHSTNSTQNAAQQDETEHTEYEMIFQAEGTLEEVGGLGLHLKGSIRVIQGPRRSVRLTDDTLVYAFLSVDDINLPLLPDQVAKRLGPLQFEFSIPQRTFVVTLEKETPDEITDAFVNVLKWFCQWPQSAEAFETVEAASVPASDAAPKKKSSLDGVADKGVAFVERIGNRINEAVERQVQTQIEAASESEPRKIPTGGKVTRTVLGGARKVVSGGAQVASTVSDKTSNVVGSALGSNPVMKNLRNAPDDSSRRKLHDTLISGMAAVGRVYVAADEKGKLIINTAGQGSAEVVAQRFGDDAATAVRDTARIAYDGYRILRFPTKLGASALLKGAAKASLSRHAHAGV